MYRRLFLCFISVVLAHSVYTLWDINKYMKAVDTPVEVKQIYSGTSSGKHSRMEFIAVYQTRDGTIFDRNISAASFYQLQPGDKITLNIRPYDIKQTAWQNAIWFFGALAYYVIAGALSIGLFVLAAWPDRRKKK